MSIASSVTAQAVHALTASGALIGLLALHAAWGGDFRTAFLWLIAATAIDAVDGWLARLARVGTHAPEIDGARLDDIVDYVTYVFVPAAIMLRGVLFPAAWAWPAAGAVVLSSAFGFSRTNAKTPDHFFTGFPSYWNIVALYLMLLGLAPAWNLGVVLALAALVFVPIGYLYPSRMTSWRTPTLVFGAAWAAQMVWIVWRLPAISPAAVLWSLAFPAYYVVLSLVLHARRVAP
jgi:phosphatidylcholine synthase